MASWKDVVAAEPEFIEITEVVLTTVGTPPDHLVIQSWHPGRGLTFREHR
jgi:hypothetical protein